MSERTILIVEDEPDIRDSLVEFFEEEGYRVEAATDGRAALAKLQALQRPCVVLLDLVMPVMGGAETIEAMRASNDLARIPVIVSTSDPSRAPAGVPVLRKPFDLYRLLEAVEASF